MYAAAVDNAWTNRNKAYAPSKDESPTKCFPSSAYSCVLTAPSAIPSELNDIKYRYGLAGEANSDARTPTFAHKTSTHNTGSLPILSESFPNKTELIVSNTPKATMQNAIPACLHSATRGGSEP